MVYLIGFILAVLIWMYGKSFWGKVSQEMAERNIKLPKISALLMLKVAWVLMCVASIAYCAKLICSFDFTGAEGYALFAKIMFWVVLVIGGMCSLGLGIEKESLADAGMVLLASLIVSGLLAGFVLMLVVSWSMLVVVIAITAATAVAIGKK